MWGKYQISPHLSCTEIWNFSTWQNFSPQIYPWDPWQISGMNPTNHYDDDSLEEAAVGIVPRRSGWWWENSDDNDDENDNKYDNNDSEGGDADRERDPAKKIEIAAAISSVALIIAHHHCPSGEDDDGDAIEDGDEKDGYIINVNCQYPALAHIISFGFKFWCCHWRQIWWCQSTPMILPGRQHKYISMTHCQLT